jgi:hypothetical protein
MRLRKHLKRKRGSSDLLVIGQCVVLCCFELYMDVILAFVSARFLNELVGPNVVVTLLSRCGGY